MSAEWLRPALGGIAQAWVAGLWLIGPALVLATFAFALRFSVAGRALRRFDRRGEGAWLDGRSARHGVLARQGHDREAISKWISIGHGYTKKPNARPASPSVVLERALGVRLDDGATIELPAGTTVRIGLMDSSRLEVERAGKRVAGNGDYAHPVRLAAGAPVWLLAPIEAHRTEAGPMRSMDRLALAPGAAVDLSSEAPVAPECSFSGAYALAWLALVGGAWIATADGWRYPAMALEGLWGALALVSIKNSLGLARGLREARS